MDRFKRMPEWQFQLMCLGCVILALVLLQFAFTVQALRSTADDLPPEAPDEDEGTSLPDPEPASEEDAPEDEPEDEEGE